MNRKTIKKALLHISNGRSMKEAGQFTGVEWRDLRNELSGIGVTSESDARKKLKGMQDEDILLQVKNDRSADDVSGQIVPEVKDAEPFEHQGNFDRAAAIVNDNNTTKERIPLAEQKEFRRDMKTCAWLYILRKWDGRYGLNEDLLMEQAVLLSPNVAKERFGFGTDTNFEDRKRVR